MTATEGMTATAGMTATGDSMNFQIKSGDLSKEKGCLIVGVHEKGELSPSAARLDKISQGHIKNIIKQSGFAGKSGQILPLYQVPRLNAELILLVGCGKRPAIHAREY